MASLQSNVWFANRRTANVFAANQLQALLARSAAGHDHLCPRQALGVRIGLLAGKVLDVPVPQADKRLFAFVECDGCGMGGVAVASGCFVERRTLRVLDYGKLAATFVDTHTGRCIRIHPAPNSRELAEQACPHAASSWHSQLEAYQFLPDEDLLSIQQVELAVSLEEIISQPGRKAICERCGEEISNDRQVIRNGRTLCRPCAGETYFTFPGQAGRARANGSTATPLVTIIGASGSGKTTLLEKLVKELTARGVRIAAVKHHSHCGFEIDVPGKDSWRFAQAGSRHVVIAAPDQIAAYRQVDGELTLEAITAEIHDCDLILVEGYKQANRPSIEVVRAANSQDLVGTKEQRIAIVSDIRWNLGVPHFSLDEIQAIADFIQDRFLDPKL